MAKDRGTRTRNILWPEIVDEVTALRAAKVGTIGGGLMIAGLFLGVVLVYFWLDYGLFRAVDIRVYYINQFIQIAIAALLTWRVYTGKGRFAAIVLLIWILAEVVLKLATGQLNLGWGIMWLFAILSLIHSVRGSWALRRFTAGGMSII